MVQHTTYNILPVLTSRHLLLQDPRTCIQLLRAVRHHASETWPLTKTNLQRNDRVMIRQICSIKPHDVATVRSSELLAKLELEDLALILRGFAGFGIWSVLVVQSGQNVIYRLMAVGGGRSEPNGERLPRDWNLTAVDSQEIRCETCALKRGS